MRSSDVPMGLAAGASTRFAVALVVLSLSASACGGVAASGGAEVPSRRDGGPDASNTAPWDATGSEKANNGRADAGPAPPDYCVPPCVWRAMLACMPPSAMLCHEVVPTDPGGLKLLCDPASGWFRRVTDWGSGGVSVEYGHDGRICFTVRSGGAAPGSLRVVTDGTYQIAYDIYPRVVRCPDDSQDYALDPRRPECARWTGPGGTGIVEPELECASTAPGTCDTAP